MIKIGNTETLKTFWWPWMLKELFLDSLYQNVLIEIYPPSLSSLHKIHNLVVKGLKTLYIVNPF